jgi:hypothetical protein
MQGKIGKIIRSYSMPSEIPVMTACKDMENVLNLVQEHQKREPKNKIFIIAALTAAICRIGIQPLSAIFVYSYLYGFQASILALRVLTLLTIGAYQ